MRRSKRQGKGKGQGQAETIAAAFFLVPIALCLIDLIVMVIANQMNDTAAKNCARAAANMTDQSTANLASESALAKFQGSSIVNKISQKTTWTADSATVQTTMSVHLPVPFPGYSDMTFVAQDVEPVLSK
jgi:Tfp pilus assembly protein PilV